MAYFDHNATTPLDERVLEAMNPYFREIYGNPSSISRIGRLARSGIELAREQIAELVSVHPSQIVFTSGGTEANNLALKGAVTGMGFKKVAWSAIEHPSIYSQRSALLRLGCEIREIPVAPQGCVEERALRQLIGEFSPQLVSVMLANNETGAIQDICGLKAHSGDAIFHTDATQAIGKIPVDFAELGVDLMSLSAHKFYGPKGIGALIVNKSLNLESLLHGGGHEKGLRAGTENVPAIVGFGHAAQLVSRELDERAWHLKALRSRFEQGLRQISGIRIFGADVPRLPNTSFFGVEGIDGEALVLALDTLDVALASGSACSSKTGKPSHVLMAMGYDESIARTAVRASFGKDNTFEEVDQCLHALVQQVKHLQSFSQLLTES